MVFLKTKNIRTKRVFLIVLSLFIINGGVATLFAHQLATATGVDSSVVKNDSIVIKDVDQIEEEGDVESLLEEKDSKPIITVYTVKAGESLSTIASKFSISTNTLLWANDLDKKSVIKEGQKLTILPVSGIVYTVVKGNTLGGIANKFDASLDEIIAFNDLEGGKPIKVGMKLIIPNAELPVEKKATPQVAKTIVKKEIKTETKVAVKEEKKIEEKKDVEVVVSKEVPQEDEDEPSSSGYFTHPIPNSVLTQGAHGYNSVDFGAKIGTTVVAAASGKVIIAKPSGYNGGYGKNIVIEHDNGTQTLYAHLSSVSVSDGDEVNKGQKIALSGNTGRSTGPHLHFEVRGGTNPWTSYKKMTKF